MFIAGSIPKPAKKNPNCAIPKLKLKEINTTPNNEIESAIRIDFLLPKLSLIQDTIKYPIKFPKYTQDEAS